MNLSKVLEAQQRFVGRLAYASPTRQEHDIDVDRLDFIHPKLHCAIQRLERAQRLNAIFETSVSGLHFNALH
jgi:hypothetical protein